MVLRLYSIHFVMGSCLSFLRHQTLSVTDIHTVTYKKTDPRVLDSISQKHGVTIIWKSCKVGYGRRMWSCQIKGSQPGLDRAYGELSNYIDELERSDGISYQTW